LCEKNPSMRAGGADIGEKKKLTAWKIVKKTKYKKGRSRR